MSGDTIFGNGNDLRIPLPANAFTVRPIAGDRKGSETITFTITGLTVNDIYRITVLGGGNAVEDWAGNFLDGEFSGTFPSGNGNPGGNFNLDFVVLRSDVPGRVIYVGTPNGVPDGSLAKPYPTIQAGINATRTAAIPDGTVSSPTPTRALPIATSPVPTIRLSTSCFRLGRATAPRSRTNTIPVSSSPATRNRIATIT